MRYCPGIIFSCSGYTLSYKYLCFIEQRDKTDFLKFFFSQSHKYIILIFIALFVRYSLYYVDVIIWSRRRPLLELFKYNLENSDGNYIQQLFTCLIYYFGNEKFKNRQNIIQYFYVPLNEIFFFIFGTILISLGYKYKLKIDFFILFFILLIYIGKIIGFNLYLLENEMYSTLYFYLYGYGAIMTNPIFNLPSFLMGMYFGMINYSIQRGIVLYLRNKSDCYAPITLLIENNDKEEDKVNDEEQLNLFEPSESDNSSRRSGKFEKHLSFSKRKSSNIYLSSTNQDSLNNNNLTKVHVNKKKTQKK